MPRGDATGPAGMGPGTGWGMGPCGGHGHGVGSGAGAAAYGPPFGGHGFGRGLGINRGGRGHRNWFRATGLPGWARAGYAPPSGWGGATFHGTPQQERQVLEAQLEQLRGSISGIEARLRDFEATEAREPQE